MPVIFAVIYFTGNTLDILTTYLAVSNGATEMNILYKYMPSLEFFLIWKFIVGIAFFIIFHWIYEAGYKFAVIAPLMLGIAFILLSINNLYVFLY